MALPPDPVQTHAGGPKGGKDAKRTEGEGDPTAQGDLARRGELPEATIFDAQRHEKNVNKLKAAQKIINEAIVSQRQRDLYFAEKGYFPEEFDWPDWKIGIERSRYVKEITQANPTHSSKRPSRSKKEVTPPSKHIPWTPPK